MDGLFEPNYISLEYFFGKTLDILTAMYNFMLTQAFTIVFIIVGIIFVVVIINYIIRVTKIRKEEKMELYKPITATAAPQKRNEQWEKVLAHLESTNPSDWRVSIMEADSMLDELVKKMRYKGENMGERMKNADRGKFKTLQSAWEAHLIRNKVAHEGSQFDLPHDEARRVIRLYEVVFNEFDFI